MSPRQPTQPQARREWQGFSLAALRRVLLDFVVDAHEPCESADEGADDREQRPCVHPAIEEPATCPEQEDGDREVECHPEVLVALTVALRLGSFVFLCGSHVARGNLETNCQGGNAMWRLRVETDYLRCDAIKPVPRPPSLFPGFRSRRAARAPGVRAH